MHKEMSDFFNDYKSIDILLSLYWTSFICKSFFFTIDWIYALLAYF
jgi:hypothetical protein